MRQELYDDIISALRSIDNDLIKTIDLWNENVYFIEEGEVFDKPAVFVEFGEIEWSVAKGGSHLHFRGKGTIRLHIVTDWHGSAKEGAAEKDANLACWQLAETIHRALEGLCGESYCNLSLIQTLTNHNHEDIYENIEVYKVEFQRLL